MTEAAVKTTSVISRAWRDSCGAPGWTLFIIFFAYGAGLESIGFDALQSAVSTMFIYALPGQIVAVNGIAAGSSLLGIAFVTWLINIRLLPMALTLAPLFKKGSHSPVSYYLSAHFIAVTGWLNFIDNHRSVPQKDVLRYFIYSGEILWVFSLCGTLAGFYVVNYIPHEVFLSLLLINPLYFLCVIAKHGSQNACIGIAVLGGCLLYMPFTLLNQDFALLFAGISGGSLAFAFHQFKQ